MVAGSKTFTLLPPAEVYRMRLRQYNTATYRPVGARAADADAMAVANGALPLRPQLDPAGETVLWSSVPPEPEQAAARAASAARAAARTAAGEAADGGGGEGAEEGAEEDEEEEEPFDLFNDPQLPPPLKVTVKAGEALYLPAMWWHHVRIVQHSCLSWFGQVWPGLTEGWVLPRVMLCCLLLLHLVLRLAG